MYVYTTAVCWRRRILLCRDSEAVRRNVESLVGRWRLPARRDKPGQDAPCGTRLGYCTHQPGAGTGVRGRAGTGSPPGPVIATSNNLRDDRPCAHVAADARPGFVCSFTGPSVGTGRLLPFWAIGRPGLVLTHQGCPGTQPRRSFRPTQCLILPHSAGSAVLLPGLGRAPLRSCSSDCEIFGILLCSTGPCSSYC